MDRKQLIGFVLIFLILIAINFINQPSKKEIAHQKKIQDSLKLVEQKKEKIKDISSKLAGNSPALTDSINASLAKSEFGNLYRFSSGQEQEFKLENDDVVITFTNKGGRIKGVRLKKYDSWLEGAKHEKIVKPIDLLAHKEDVFSFSIPVSQDSVQNIETKDLYFHPVIEGRKITFTVEDGNGLSFIQTYTLPEKGYQLDYTVLNTGIKESKNNKLQLSWQVHLTSLEKGVNYEKTYSTLFYHNSKKAEHLSYTKNDTETPESSSFYWISNVNQFFNSTLIDKSGLLGHGKFEIESVGKDEVKDFIKICSSNVTLPANKKLDMSFYVGPNEFNNLKAYHKDLEMIIPYGWNIFGALNRWIIRPMFLFLFNIVGSMGIAIIVLIFIIKGIVSPLNYKMILSSSKMQSLKPEIDKIKEKTKDNLQDQQLKTMELYRKYGVSPFGGCMPMLLQMPLWISLFRFFPAAIEFRHVPFLWANDLSAYESIAYLPFNIPMYGSHVSLFALLWGISSVIYSYYNMQTMDMSNQQNQAMKYMQYFMPIFFIVFFNQYASGLNIYMFFSNLFTILMTIITKRFFIDQDKIRAQLELKKDNPKKKSKFSQRLEEAMKQQQMIADQRKKGK